jgi:hypothetical protein
MAIGRQSRLSINPILGSCLLLYLVLPCSYGVTEQKTEIVVIGTAETETQSFRIQDLVGILKKVKPHVILFECPVDMMTPSYEFKTILKDSLPQQAVLEYDRQTGAKIRPFDIDGRNAFYARTIIAII